MNRRLLALSALAVFPACDKPQQDTSNPVYVTDEDRAAKEMPDYTKSACAGQARKVKTAAGEAATTCKAEGSAFRLYVDDRFAVKPADLQAAAAGLDRVADTTAHDPMMGIVGNVFAVLGTPSADALEDGKLAVFAITDLGGEAWTSTNGGGGKPIEALHRVDPEQTLDAPFNAALGAKAIAEAVVLAGDADEERWIVESLGWAGSIAGGLYGTDKLVDDFLAQPNRAWGPGASSVDPGAALLFGAFLYERFGPAFTKALVGEAANGWDGLEAVSKAQAKAGDRMELFKQWSLTVWFTDPGTGYGYKFSGLSQPEATIVKDTLHFEGTAQAWGLTYYQLPPGAPIPVTFASTGDAFAFVGMHNDEGVAREELIKGTPLRLDLTQADRAVVIVSAPATSSYTLALDEATAVKAEKELAKAKKKADKEEAKKAKQAEKDAKKAEKDAEKDADKDAKKADKDADKAAKADDGAADGEPKADEKAKKADEKAKKADEKAKKADEKAKKADEKAKKE